MDLARVHSPGQYLIKVCFKFGLGLGSRLSLDQWGSQPSSLYLKLVPLDLNSCYMSQASWPVSGLSSPVIIAEIMGYVPPHLAFNMALGTQAPASCL